jgi:Bardet-Biedl syndrome 7 protein
LDLRDSYKETLDKSTTLSALKSFNVTDKFELNRDDASYTLSLSCDVPIDYVLLQCNVPVDLLDGHKNAAVSSYSECDENVCAWICSLFFVSFFKK